MADDFGWKAVTLEGELAHRASVISVARPRQPSLCDNALVGKIQASFRKQILYIAETQRESGIQPD
jgi:hypothetical protein